MAKKPYNGNYREDCEKAANWLKKDFHDSRAKRECRNIDDFLLYNCKFVKYTNRYDGSWWAIKVLGVSRAYPIEENGIRIRIPKSEIGKYSNFKVEPAN